MFVAVRHTPFTAILSPDFNPSVKSDSGTEISNIMLSPTGVSKIISPIF